MGRPLGRSPTADGLREAFDAGESVRAIAGRLGCAPRTVRNVARRNRLTLPKTICHYPDHIERASSYSALYRPGWLAEQLSSGRTLASVAGDVGSSVGAVRVAVAKQGISERRSYGEIRFPELHDRRWLRDQYLRQGRSAAEIARLLGASESATLRALHRARITLRPQRKARPSERRLRADWRLFPRVAAVARLNGVSPALAEVWLAEVGILARRTPPISPDTLGREVDAGRSVGEIATRLRVDQRVVRVELCRLRAEPIDQTRL